MESGNTGNFSSGNVTRANVTLCDNVTAVFDGHVTSSVSDEDYPSVACGRDFSRHKKRMMTVA